MKTEAEIKERYEKLISDYKRIRASGELTRTKKLKYEGALSAFEWILKEK